MFHPGRRHNKVTSKALHPPIRLPSPESTAVTASTEHHSRHCSFQRRDHPKRSTRTPTTPRPHGWRRWRCKAMAVEFPPKSKRVSNRLNGSRRLHNILSPSQCSSFCFPTKILSGSHYTTTSSGAKERVLLHTAPACCYTSYSFGCLFGVSCGIELR